jgi:ABC-type glycerol-3-phosphate transport system permease component
MAANPEVPGTAVQTQSRQIVRRASKANQMEDYERSRPRWLQALVLLLLIIGSLIYAFPFFWMLSTSLKIPENIYLDPPQWIPDPVAWSNYVEIFGVGPVWSWIYNSTLITVVAVLTVC